jgi:hypothetical protein
MLRVPSRSTRSSPAEGDGQSLVAGLPADHRDRKPTAVASHPSKDAARKSGTADGKIGMTKKRVSKKRKEKHDIKKYLNVRVETLVDGVWLAGKLKDSNLAEDMLLPGAKYLVVFDDSSVTPEWVTSGQGKLRIV